MASQLARFLPGWVLLIRFKKLKNVQFTTKAVSNMKDQVKKKTYSVILKCIDDSTHFDRFLRFVQAAPQPLPFLADDRELLDLERFCTNPSKPGILSIDTTYNCGELYVTPTTYRHQSFWRREQASIQCYSGRRSSISIEVRKPSVISQAP